VQEELSEDELEDELEEELDDGERECPSSTETPATSGLARFLGPR
jgi:hypothetical protein